MNLIKITALVAALPIVFILQSLIAESFTTNRNKLRFNPDLPFITPDFTGNPVTDNDRFMNMKSTRETGVFDIIKWKFSKNPQAEEKKSDTFRLQVTLNSSFIDSDKDLIVWLGHASFFIRIDGITILTDPIFGKATVVPRETGVACNTDMFKNIDYLLISHNHRDHLDLDTLKEIYKNNPNIHALIPLKMSSDLTGDLTAMQYTEAGWYQNYNLSHPITITFLPTQHWSKRWLRDENRSLWGSFMIQGKNKILYFGADSAYADFYKKFAEIFPQIDYALIPIGAYKPAYIMKDSHMTPEEALDSFNDLNAKIMIPMHYGTYDLADEPIGEPIIRLRSAAAKQNASDKIVEAVIGESIEL
ncbi:MAG: MBL fold metallo-hydrolase [Spirochaetes bacterium]|jgi:L-ascorbate metabolism protein UlaG (beta-lactamase superfamily)|nr:MBL fold metallo-hydrolase [Spirochaetota bacterium]